MQAHLQFQIQQGKQPGTLILKILEGETDQFPTQLLQELLEGTEPQIGDTYTVLSVQLRINTPPVKFTISPSIASDRIQVSNPAPSGNGFGLPQMDEDTFIPRGENQ